MNVNELIKKIRLWQDAYTEYKSAADEVLQNTNGKGYPSSPRRRAAIKVLDSTAMEIIHDVHNDDALEALVTLADEVDRLQKNVKRLNKTANLDEGYIEFLEEKHNDL